MVNEIFLASSIGTCLLFFFVRLATLSPFAFDFRKPHPPPHGLHKVSKLAWYFDLAWEGGRMTNLNCFWTQVLKLAYEILIWSSSKVWPHPYYFTHIVHIVAKTYLPMKFWLGFQKQGWTPSILYPQEPKLAWNFDLGIYYGTNYQETITQAY
jgi:hypothetical protein